jgi:nicotinamidase-related amidase
MHDFISSDNKHSALIIIDVQRDFALSGSNAEIPGTMQTVQYIQILVKACRNLGHPIISKTIPSRRFKRRPMQKRGYHEWGTNGNCRECWR